MRAWGAAAQAAIVADQFMAVQLITSLSFLASEAVTELWQALKMPTVGTHALLCSLGRWLLEKKRARG